MREVFSSPVDRVIVICLKADKPGKVTFTAGMKTPQKASVTVESPNTLVPKQASYFKFQCKRVDDFIRTQLFRSSRLAG
jgi:hypothetical protein